MRTDSEHVDGRSDFLYTLCPLCGVHFNWMLSQDDGAKADDEDAAEKVSD